MQTPGFRIEDFKFWTCLILFLRCLKWFFQYILRKTSFFCGFAMLAGSISDCVVIYVGFVLIFTNTNFSVTVTESEFVPVWWQ